jgi:hypothetical protein
MMTIADFAKKRGVPIPTVYSWIYRSQAAKNGFKVVQVGSIKLIQEIKIKKRETV